MFTLDSLLCFSLDFLAWRRTSHIIAMIAHRKAKPPAAPPAMAPTGTGLESDVGDGEAAAADVALKLEVELAEVVTVEVEDIKVDWPCTGG